MDYILDKIIQERDQIMNANYYYKVYVGDVPGFNSGNLICNEIKNTLENNFSASYSDITNDGHMYAIDGIDIEINLFRIKTKDPEQYIRDYCSNSIRDEILKLSNKGQSKIRFEAPYADKDMCNQIENYYGPAFKVFYLNPILIIEW